jgi:hypothetical protein
MEEPFRDFLNALHGNARALLYRQWMLLRKNLEVRPASDRLRQDPHFQISRTSVDRDLCV